MRVSISAVSASCLLVALAMSLGSPVATAANGDRCTEPRHVVRHPRPLYATYGWPRGASPATLPQRPEYGFLDRVPPNAVRMPGYTFVPGVGILGESCDLPTSACSNEYRDVQ
jgi:hypothetical protein